MKSGYSYGSLSLHKRCKPQPRLAINRYSIEPMYKKILVVVNDSAASEAAIRQGIEIARVHRAALMLFHVLPKGEIFGLDVPGSLGVSSQDFDQRASEKASQTLAMASALAEYEGVHSFRAMSHAEDEAKCVSEAASVHHCDLIVVGTEGQNALVRLLTGSIVPRLITVATVPVLVCKESDATPKQRHRSKVAIRAQSKHARESGNFQGQGNSQS